MKSFSKFLLLTFAFITLCCKSYTIPIESFKEQMVSAKKNNLKSVSVNNPLLGYQSDITYDANNIEKLIVYDKNGNQTYLNNSASIEMRVTLKSGKRRIFYFDTVTLENGVLSGSQSRFIGKTRQIPIDSIIKVEVQDGRKKFNYQ